MQAIGFFRKSLISSQAAKTAIKEAFGEGIGVLFRAESCIRRQAELVAIA